MKLMFCELCGDIVTPRDKVATWCQCRRHAVWWEDPSAGKLVMFDGKGETVKGGHYDGMPKDMPRASVIGLHNELLISDLNTAAKIADAIDATPDSYIFKQRRSLVIRFRPLESSDTRWSSKLP